jgi:diguanylate cyclase (GGDEF)-like protein
MHSADPLLSHAGAAGEVVIARIRLILTFALLVVPVTTLLIEPWSSQYAIGLGVLICALVISAGVYALVRRGFTHIWLGVVSTAMDVTLVSAALLSFLVLDEPNAAVNNRIIFDCYFIAIGVTCLRYDVRLCALAGVLAALQYLGIALYADANWDPVAAIYQPDAYGIFDWGTQLSRVVLLAMAAWLAATVVSRGQTLRRLSSIDRMTGVYNRGYFDERLSAELSRARRQSEPLAIVMLDVDHFKKFNDNYGHAAGDAGLRALTSLIRTSLRRSDLVARYGGEEFVLVLPVTTADQAVDKMNLMREAAAQLPIRLPKQQTTAILTVSAGVAVFPDDGVTADELLDCADERLFQAKQAGRNRVVGPAIGVEEKQVA